MQTAAAARAAKAVVAHLSVLPLTDVKKVIDSIFPQSTNKNKSRNQFSDDLFLRDHWMNFLA